MVRAIRLLKAGSQYRKNDSVLFYLLKKTQIRAVAENAHRFFYALSRYFLDGLSGLAPVFQTFYIQVWKNISVVFFHTPRIYTL